jgi:hypothetical protein
MAQIDRSARRLLLEQAAKAASYVGERREWTPYTGARPVVCTAFHCGIGASINDSGCSVSVGHVWTTYMERAAEERVWFPQEVWEAMPIAPTQS